MLQTIIVRASVNQASVIPSIAKITLDLRVVHFPEGSLHFKVAEERESTKKLKNLSLNLVALPLQMFYELHQGVTNELKIREK